MPKNNTQESSKTAKRDYRKANSMRQLVTRKNDKGASHFIISSATNKSLYLLVNLEAMMEGKSVSRFVEEILMQRYGDRIGNFDVAFANLRKLEGR